MSLLYGSDGTRENFLARIRAEREQFEAQVVSGEWPADSCAGCIARGVGKVVGQSGGTTIVLGGSACCQSYGHHVGSFCLHCGNDERGTAWKYRGN